MPTTPWAMLAFPTQPSPGGADRMGFAKNQLLSIEKISATRWLITQDNLLTQNEHEDVSFSVVVPISDANVGELQQQAIRRAIELLSGLLLKPKE
ncbi:hypothetical protein [Delftia acidovorans]|uniref:hypothetical protein n=2 Tax=Delftia acidovorans TaxID=80866 RepID=UPI0035A02382